MPATGQAPKKSLAGGPDAGDPALAALEAARAQAAAVRRYLEAILVPVPSRGRRRAPESIAGRLAAVEAALVDADGGERRALTTERRQLRARLRDLEAGFVAVGAAYSERTGIRHETWLAAGVPARVLRAAGIVRAPDVRP